MSARVVIHERVRDVELLLGTDNPENIARRLGYGNLANLRRMMRKAGRYDLSDRLGPDTAGALATRRAMRRYRKENAA